VVNPQFGGAGDFSEGLAMVQMKTEQQKNEEAQWGYINRKGQVKIKPQFDFADVFIGGLARVATFTRDGSVRFGYINKKGRHVWGPVEYTKPADIAAVKEIMAGAGLYEEVY